MKRRVLCGVLLSLAAAVTRTSASVPVGVYAVVDKVVLESGSAGADRVQIWGTFALWDSKGRMGYRPPERGYIYYRCSNEDAAMCRNEWADLRSVAGTGEIVGFGSRSLLSGRVRPSGERATNPESYPIQFGVVKMGPVVRGEIFDRLKAVARGL